MLHIVGFSGGVDSQACAGWVLERNRPEDVILINSDAGGNEHPLTTEHCQWYSDNVHPVVMIQALIRDLANVGTRSGRTGERRREFDENDLLTFDRLAYIKQRYPWRKVQFCTEYLKLRPQLRWMEENIPLGEAYVRYSGVRADESHLRSKQPETEWDDFFDCELRRPLIRWSKKEVFEYLKARGEKINPLYLMGFSRVGCATCVNSGKDDVRLWSARFPEMIQKVRDWEKSVGRTFFPPCVPGKEINWIDEVVEWSKTLRGGKRVSLSFVEEEAKLGGCVSKYGLCE